MISLFRREPDGSQRLYTISDQQLTLPGTWGFTVSWMSGGSWRERQRSFSSAAEMDKAMRELLRRKTREGYRLLYSWDSPGKSGSEAIVQDIFRLAR